MNKNRNFASALRFALAGIKHTAKHERNFRIHIIAAVLALVFCFVFRVDGWLFLAVVLSIFFVLAMELVNTAVEAAVDLVCKDTLHPLAKIAKDAAAGAVLLASFQAVIVGAIVIISVIRSYL
ncbi:MAG: diacylglycerol kinase family protein [Defluviitaleaceae bacterium]|nr:diacylglycerol kinase family protein [Defluviitaleaceae bacterium]